MDKTGGKEMQMNDENIQTEEVKRAAEPEYKIPEDATDNSRPNETAEVVTRESTKDPTQPTAAVTKEVTLVRIAAIVKPPYTRTRR